ncbi:MAG: DUF4260 domain-containing protein [Chitinophagales bacterium]|nr:DUF4260 domain-containing protein [Chitinophagales bacterium]
MKNLLKLEELGMFLLAVFLFYFQLDYAGWLYWALLLAPDISMIGYAFNTRTGAFTYNLIHHKLTGILFYMVGSYFTDPALQLTGLILFGHSSMDRIFDYGLKYRDAFKHTHLGWLPQKK